MRIHTCDHCQRGDHARCELTKSVPPGHFGGSKCICACNGDPNWRARQQKEQEEELRRLSSMHAAMNTANQPATETPEQTIARLTERVKELEAKQTV
jgi:hypothetical protein